MCWSITHLVLILALTFSIAEASSASNYARDESNEDTNTEFNLATTFKGGITSNRHHERARLNSQLYPDLRQQPAASYPYGDIDGASGHESGGSGVDLRSGAYAVPVPQSVDYAGQPAQQLPVAPPPPACGRPATGVYPNSVPTGCQQPSGGQAGYPIQQYPPNQNPLAAAHSGGNAPSYGTHQPAYQPAPSSQPPQPGYAYPGQHLPQYPVYMPGYYPGMGPAAIGMAGNLPIVNYPAGVAPSAPPPVSYQNQYNYAPHPRPGQGDHWNHRYKVQTEYTEDGVHKGPFGVLNNHGTQGYGSGFSSGYNGAYSRPGY
ncbi:translation initiation factor IF-2 [Drosophila grimshawi]|uniref:GH17061 n=1 Tax=Drosophila grimshawi TaxID=7222 RepID=B4JU82_DROGR|nr:translation initiation factor IF-2 [Drosophila grimshawi]EDV91052.1 GH17061 [Drosophila grimshawi]